MTGRAVATSYSRRSWLRLAAFTLIVSGVVAAVGVVFLAAMFLAFAAGAQPAGLAFGRINDVLGIGSSLLMVPGVLAVHGLLRPRWPVTSALVAAVGSGAIAAIVILQVLLVTEALTFEEQIGPVSVAFLVLAAWFVATGSMGARTGLLPRGGRMGLLAATYVGYPLWAVWMGRRLLATADL